MPLLQAKCCQLRLIREKSVRNLPLTTKHQIRHTVFCTSTTLFISPPPPPPPNSSSSFYRGSPSNECQLTGDRVVIGENQSLHSITLALKLQQPSGTSLSWNTNKPTGQQQNHNCHNLVNKYMAATNQTTENAKKSTKVISLHLHLYIKLMHYEHKIYHPKLPVLMYYSLLDGNCFVLSGRFPQQFSKIWKGVIFVT